MAKILRNVWDFISDDLFNVFRVMIPNILEAWIRGDLKVLEDWCHERVSTNCIAKIIRPF